MARIDEMNGRKDGAYTRLFGDERLGHLVSQTHAAAIRMGTELEKALISAIPKGSITTIDEIAKGLAGEGQIVIKPEKPEVSGATRGIVSDFAVFNHSKRQFFVVELKDGDTFDTQKAPATKKSLQENAQYISFQTRYRGAFCVCSFNAPSRESIVAGFKNEFSLDQVMTGQELCYHLGVDYEEILAQRQDDQEHNKYHFLAQAGKIESDMPPDEYFKLKKKQEIEQYKFRWVRDNNDTE